VWQAPIEPVARPVPEPPAPAATSAPVAEPKTTFELPKSQRRVSAEERAKEKVAWPTAAVSGASAKPEGPTTGQRGSANTASERARARSEAAQRRASMRAQQGPKSPVDRDRALARARDAADQDRAVSHATPAPSTSSVRPAPSSGGPSGAGSLSIATLVGALGMLLAVVLATGALLVSLGADEAHGAFSVLAAICDALAGWLRGLFDFGGSNAHQKQSLLAWGCGAVVYLGIGLAAQTFVRKRP
jgi:hypothetical protein